MQLKRLSLIGIPPLWMQKRKNYYSIEKKICTPLKTDKIAIGSPFLKKSIEKKPHDYIQDQMDILSNTMGITHLNNRQISQMNTKLKGKL